MNACRRLLTVRRAVIKFTNRFFLNLIGANSRQYKHIVCWESRLIAILALLNSLHWGEIILAGRFLAM